MRNSPHDQFVLFAFSHRQVYMDFFEQIVPRYVGKRLNLETLKPVDGTFLNRQLQKTFSDKSFTCQL